MDSSEHRRITLGIELEAYTIHLPDCSIGRQLAFPRPGISERGERFARDASIGTEYNSPPFATIRKGLFLLRSGLRKYGSKRFRSKSREAQELLLVGGWRDRFAGAHIHLALADQDLTKPLARRLAAHLHDHIPFLVALGANSPVWADEITPIASNRVHRASNRYFRPIESTQLYQRSYDEMLFSRGRKTKPATLELRVLDSNVPDFVMATACVVKAIALNWLMGIPPRNRVGKAEYLQSRADAAQRGMNAKLCWNGEWLTVPQYLDKFIWTHRHSLEAMDIPEEVWIAFKLFKRKINGAALIGTAARLAHREHPQTWQRRFAKRYASAIDELLGGDTLVEFAGQLQVELPDLERVWLGRRNLVLA